MDDSAELVAAWNRAQPRFDDPSVRPSQKAWIGLTRPLALIEDTALLAAPNDYAKDYLENRLRPLITSVLSDELGRDVQIAVTVQTSEPGTADDLADGDADGASFDGLTTDEDDLEADAQRPLPGFGPALPPQALGG